MKTWAYFLTILGGVVQLVGVALVFGELKSARMAAADILVERGEIAQDVMSQLRQGVSGGAGRDADQALSDMVVLRNRLSEYLRAGLWQRRLAAGLVLAGIAITTIGATVALASG